jgi:hypothetical protein
MTLSHTITTLFIITFMSGAGLRAQGGTPAPVPKPEPERLTVTAVVGCVAAEGQNWVLTNASAPIVVPATDGKTLTGSLVTADRAKQEPAGKEKYRLINMLTEFGVPEHKGQRALVKGLILGSGADRRINLVSFEPVAPTCS